MPSSVCKSLLCIIIIGPAHQIVKELTAFLRRICRFGFGFLLHLLRSHQRRPQSPQSRPAGDLELSTQANLFLTQINPSSIATSSRTNSSHSSRPPTGNSFAASVGPNARPVSSMGRYTSTNNFSQSVNGRQRTNSRARPVSVLGTHNAVFEAAPVVQQNGTKSSSLIPSATRKHSQAVKTLRNHASTSSLVSGLQVAERRELSWTTKMQNMSLEDNDTPVKGSEQSQVISDSKEEVQGAMLLPLVLSMGNATVRPSKCDDPVNPSMPASITTPSRAMPSPPKTPARG